MYAVPSDAVHRWQDRTEGVLVAADAIAHAIAERVADAQSHRRAHESAHAKPHTARK